MKNIPALLISQEAKRRQAKLDVEKAILTIKQLGPLAGISGRSMFEYNVLSGFMQTEVREAQRNETEQTETV